MAGELIVVNKGEEVVRLDAASVIPAVVRRAGPRAEEKFAEFGARAEFAEVFVVDDRADEVDSFQAEFGFGELAGVVDPVGGIRQPDAPAELENPFGGGEIGLREQRESEEE